MEAAKRMYDNSYNQRQETASMAKAYLDDAAPRVKPEVVKKKTSNIICNVLGIITSIAYCMLILGLLLMPLIRETQLAKIKIEENIYKIEISRLNQDIEDAKLALENKKDMDNIERVAIEKLGLVKKSAGEIEIINTNRYHSLADARDAYYNTNYEFSTSDE